MNAEHIEHRRLSVSTPSLTLQAQLALPYAAAKGLLILVTSGREAAADVSASDEWPLQDLHREGFATLAVDLLSVQEYRFADARDHLPLLGERLLAVIAHLRRQILLESIPQLPIGLAASGTMTPLALRVAAQRDQEVRALVCHGGLIDLAGRQYLRLLQAPLLLLIDAGDDAARANAERAREYLPGIFRIETLEDGAPEQRRQRQAACLQAWFRCHLAT